MWIIWHTGICGIHFHTDCCSFRTGYGNAGRHQGIQKAALFIVYSGRVRRLSADGTDHMVDFVSGNFYHCKGWVSFQSGFYDSMLSDVTTPERMLMCGKVTQ